MRCLNSSFFRSEVNDLGATIACMHIDAEIENLRPMMCAL